MNMQRIASAILVSALLVGCSDSDDNNQEVTTNTGSNAEVPADNNDNDNNTGTDREFEMTVTNLTYAQPMSPLAMIVHDGSFQGWRIGTPASVPLEQLAEEGSAAEMLAAASANPGVKMAISNEAVIAPGESDVLTIKLSGTAN